MSTAPLVIKKYGNRRLYDTENSRYITLDDLAATIRGGREVKVVDAKTGADLTKSVLLQIITEQEKENDVLPISFLTRVIQHSDTTRDAMKRYLSVSLDAFLNAQQEFEQRYRNLANPMAWMYNPFGNAPQGQAPNMPPGMDPASFFAGRPQHVPQPEPTPPPPPPPTPPVPEPKPEPEDNTRQELDQLKEQLAAMQQMLSKLSK